MLPALALPALKQILQVLRKARMGSKMLQRIQLIYDTDTARSYTQSSLSHALKCTIGVKQSCLMSPNLFGLYKDDIQELPV